MNGKLFVQAIIKFISGVVMVALMIFLPAGNLNYWNGWLFMGILFIPMFTAGIILMLKNPQLLKIRLNTKENESEQKTVILLSGIMFLAGFVLCGFNYRFSWIVLPKWVIIGAYRSNNSFPDFLYPICRSITRKYIFIKDD